MTRLRVRILIGIFVVLLGVGLIAYFAVRFVHRATEGLCFTEDLSKLRQARAVVLTDEPKDVTLFECGDSSDEPYVAAEADGGGVHDGLDCARITSRFETFFGKTLSKPTAKDEAYSEYAGPYVDSGRYRIYLTCDAKTLYLDETPISLLARLPSQ